MIFDKFLCKIKGHALQGGIQIIDDLIKVSGIPGEYVLGQCGRCGKKFKYMWIWNSLRNEKTLNRENID